MVRRGCDGGLQLVRGDSRRLSPLAEPAVVYDAETDTRYEVSPDNLVEHFQVDVVSRAEAVTDTSWTDTRVLLALQRHPLHVVDVTTTPSRVCGACSKRGRSFKYCHVDKGHPMM